MNLKSGYRILLLVILLSFSCRKPTRQLMLNIYGGKDFESKSIVEVSFTFKREEILFREEADGEDGEVKTVFIDIKDKTKVDIDAYNSSAHNFSGFSGDVSSGNKSVSIEVDGDRVVNVYFRYKPELLNEAPYKDGVYEVRHNSHLRWLAYKNSIEPILYNFQGVTIKLMKDIYLMNYDFLGFANNNLGIFEGTFDGDGKAIYGLKITTNNQVNNFAFIGNLGHAGIIKNLKIKGNVNSTSINSKNIGGLVGQNSGSIESVDATINLNGYENVAIIAGVNEGDIKDTYSRGSINGVKDVGGIVANNTGSIENSYNFANITNQLNADYSSVGGLVASNHTTGTIKESSSIGNISVLGNQNYSYIGGVAGNNKGIIESVYNVGSISISATGNDWHVGGLIGKNDNELINAYNTGEIKLTGIGNNIYAGGVLGLNSSTAKTDSVYNIALVINNMSGANIYTGGVLAKNDSGVINKYYLLKNSTINNSLNTIEVPISTSGEKDIKDFYTIFDFNINVWELATSLKPVNGVTIRPVLIGVGGSGGRP